MSLFATISAFKQSVIHFKQDYVRTLVKRYISHIVQLLIHQPFQLRFDEALEIGKCVILHGHTLDYHGIPFSLQTEAIESLRAHLLDELKDFNYFQEYCEELLEEFEIEDHLQNNHG